MAASIAIGKREGFWREDKMITAELPKDAKEKIAEEYVRRLEEENARLLRKMVAAKEGVVWSGKGIADISLFKPNAGTEWEPYTFVECDGATLEIQGRIIEEDGQKVIVTVARAE